MLSDKAQIKLIILGVYYAFAVEVKETDAAESILSTEQIHPFDCEECTSELIEEGLLRRCIVDGNACCAVTPRGVYTYRQGEELIAPAVRDELIARAVRHFESLCTGRRYDSYIEEVDGGYCVVCSLRSDTTVFMETRFRFTDKSEANAALSNCREKPEVIFNGVKTLITGKFNRIVR